MRKEVAERLQKEVRESYDAIADDFSSARTGLWPELLAFRDHVAVGDRVLDVGCGNGRAYRLFEGMAVDYVGLDASERMIAAARRNVNDMLAEFRVGDALALPFGDAEFDIVLSVATLHHVPSAPFRARALAEAARVLSPGGTLMLTVMARLRPRHVLLHAKALLRKLVGASELDLFDAMLPWGTDRGDIGRYTHWFTDREMRRLCEGAGLEVVRVERMRDGKRVPWWRADNLVVVCRKPAPDKEASPGVTGL